MSESDPLLTEQALARTYDGGDYDDAWEVVEQYRRTITYHRDNPEEGRGTVATAANAPQGRVRSWLADGRIPAAVQGLYAAHDHGWIGVTYDDLTPLNVLVANVYSGGTIDRGSYRTQFTLNEDGLDATVVTALDLAGVGSKPTNSGSENSQAIVPGQDVRILGRTLSALGAPIGSKADRDELTLPWYLEDAPDPVRKRFVDSYLENRALTAPDTDSIQIQEERPHSYLEELAELIQSVAGEQASAGDELVTVSAPAARALGYERE